MGEILTGDYLTFKAPLGGKGKIGMIGKSTQKTREGYNLFNYDSLKSTTRYGVTFTVNEDKSITANGTATQNSSFDLIGSVNNYPLNLRAGNYVLTGCDGGSVSSYYLEIYNGTRYYACTNDNIKFTFDTDTSIRCYFVFKEGATFNNFTFYPMLVAGTEKKEYEQYGAMPSPNYKSDIQNVKEKINITLCNKNLLNIPSNYQLFHLSQVMDLILTSGVYTIQFDDAITDCETITSYVCLFMKDGEPISYVHISKTSKSNTFTLKSATNQFRIWSADSENESKNVTTTYKNLMLYRDEQSSEYVEHQEQQYNFPLSENQKLYEGDYLADDGIHHKKKQIELNGTENWFQNAITKVFGFSVSDIDVEGAFNSSAKIIVMSNYFKASKYYQLYYGEVDEAISGHDSNQAIEIRATRFVTIDDLKTWLAQKKAEGNPVIVEYDLKEEKIEPYTQEQQTIHNLMQNVVLYEGTNNIFCTNEIIPTLEVETSKLIDDFDFYISSNGYLVFPQYNKKYLTNMSENVILNMPEVVQTTVKIAGKDGDLVLDSSYNSQDFQVVMFTDEGLIPEQKEKERIFINRIFNAMKKNSKTFAFEQSQKFYKVLYSGMLEETNYPQHMMFTIPLKSSKPYAYKMSSSYLLGNDTKTSETIEPTGFTCTIYGPALNPIISLNDYSMEFSNTILEGEKLIIDTNNSTAVLVNSNGIETNAMRYYNHQFPKIMEGENVLKVLSGIDNPNNVFISWYDLTL